MAGLFPCHKAVLCCAQLAAVQQRADQAARELQEAHIARLAAENRTADLQARQTTASTSTSHQVIPASFGAASFLITSTIQPGCMHLPNQMSNERLLLSGFERLEGARCQDTLSEVTQHSCCHCKVQWCSGKQRHMVQIAALERAKQSSQAQLEEATAALRKLESMHQQHLSDCKAGQTAAADREAALEQQCRQARSDASIARCRSHPCFALCISSRLIGRTAKDPPDVRIAPKALHHAPEYAAGTHKVSAIFSSLPQVLVSGIYRGVFLIKKNFFELLQ